MRKILCWVEKNFQIRLANRKSYIRNQKVTRGILEFFMNCDISKLPFLLNGTFDAKETESFTEKIIHWSTEDLILSTEGLQQPAVQECIDSTSRWD